MVGNPRDVADGNAQKALFHEMRCFVGELTLKDLRVGAHDHRLLRCLSVHRRGDEVRKRLSCPGRRLHCEPTSPSQDLRHGICHLRLAGALMHPVASIADSLKAPPGLRSHRSWCALVLGIEQGIVSATDVGSQIGRSGLSRKECGKQEATLLKTGAHEWPGHVAISSSTKQGPGGLPQFTEVQPFGDCRSARASEDRKQPDVDEGTRQLSSYGGPEEVGERLRTPREQKGAILDGALQALACLA